ncbi:MAG: glycosyltransferase family 2 protein [Nocardioides sp.]
MTIAIPVYNGETYLREALASVADQTMPADEVLVFDNASTDRTRAIAAEVIPDSAIRTNETNRGAAANFNRAVAGSTGTYFAWLGADDRLAPEFIERCSLALDVAPEAGACLTAIQFIDPRGQPQGLQSDSALASRDARVRLRSFLRRPRWTEVYCLYRREALLASPRFTNQYGADVLLTWWFLLRDPLLVLEEPLLEYRVYPVKTAEGTARSLNPEARRPRWLMTSLWGALWRETKSGGVDARVARAARSELRRCLVHRHWLHHIAWDFYLIAGDLLGAIRRPRRQRALPDGAADKGLR